MVKAIVLLVLSPFVFWMAFKYFTAERQRLAVKSLRSNGARVIYLNEAKRMEGPFIPHPEYPGPKFLHPILGVDFFDTIAMVSIGPKFDMSQIGDLDKLPGLVDVDFVNNKIEIDLVTSFKFAKSLRRVSFYGALDDKNTKHLLKFEQLESLTIWHNRDLNVMSDKSVDFFLKLRNLRYLQLGNQSNISAHGFSRLRKGLPNCEIGGEPYSPPKPVPKSELELIIN